MPFPRRLALTTLLLTLAGAVALPAADAKKPAKPAPAPTLVKLAWLAGSWRQEKGGRVTDEQWMAPAGGLMLGMSRTVARGKVLEHEFLQVREGPGGELFYVARPVGQAETTFQLVSLTDRAVVFENKEHDFPQTIAYALQPDGSLLAVVEGAGAGGVAKKIEFAFRRAGDGNP